MTLGFILTLVALAVWLDRMGADMMPCALVGVVGWALLMSWATWGARG